MDIILLFSTNCDIIKPAMIVVFMFLSLKHYLLHFPETARKMD